MIKSQPAELDLLVGGNHRHHLAAHPIEQYPLGQPVRSQPRRARGFGAGMRVRMRHDVKRNQVLVEKTFHTMQYVHDGPLA